MSFERFHAAIKEPALLAVAEHWNAARGTRLMPGWRDIDPSALGRYLPVVWSWRFEPAERRFIGRLAGEEIVAVIGCNIRGRPLEDCFPTADSAAIYPRYLRVVEEVACMHGAGKVFPNSRCDGYSERVVLPLAEDGEHGDGLLGATIYQLGMRLALVDEVTLNAAGDGVSYYRLRDGQ